MVTFYRRLPRFEYLAPKSLDEALEILSRCEGNAKVIAGGTDVVPRLKRRRIKDIDYVVDLKGITGLDYIRYDEATGLSIGPLATLSAVESSEVVRRKFPVLLQAVETMASPQVRNRATVAGNICNAAPSGDTAPPLLTLEASLTLVSPSGSRTVKIEDFFTGPHKTVLHGDELLSDIQIPNLPAGSRGRYLRLSPRRAMDLAIAGVAVVVTPEDGICKDVRIALGEVSPTPLRVRPAEDIVRGERFRDELIERVAQAAGECCHPISDHRASAEYRREMFKVLTRRAIREAIHA